MPIAGNNPPHQRDHAVDTIESRARNGGDGNGDGIPDAKQSDVASIDDVTRNAMVTVQVDGDCQPFDQVHTLASAGNRTDAGFSYPVGLVDFTVRCTQPGGVARMRMMYDEKLDTTGWVIRKADSHDVVSPVTDARVFTMTVRGVDVTAFEYTVHDGGIGDNDNLANGIIIDPVGLAVKKAVTGTLPATGANPTALAEIATLLLLAGIALMAIKRRRSTTS